MAGLLLGPHRGSHGKAIGLARLSLGIGLDTWGAFSFEETRANPRFLLAWQRVVIFAIFLSIFTDAHRGCGVCWRSYVYFINWLCGSG